MRLITWNVNRRVSVLAAQAAALAGRGPDVVALQEVTERSWPLWRAALETIGLPAALCSLDHADRARRPITRRRTGVVIAARELEPAPPLEVPWPETTLAAWHDGVVVHTAHVPNAANGWIKPDTLAALRAGLEGGSGPRPRPRGPRRRGGRGASRRRGARPSVYHHAWRDDGLSDHSALEADLRAAQGTEARKSAARPAE